MNAVPWERKTIYYPTYILCLFDCVCLGVSVCIFICVTCCVYLCVYDCFRDSGDCYAQIRQNYLGSIRYPSPQSSRLLFMLTIYLHSFFPSSNLRSLLLIYLFIADISNFLDNMIHITIFNPLLAVKWAVSLISALRFKFLLSTY